LISNRDCLPALRSSGNLHCLLTIESLHSNFCSECGLRKRDCHHAVQIVSIARIQRIFLYCEHNIQVTDWAPESTCLTFALIANARSLLDSGRDVDLHFVLANHATFTTAGLAWISNYLSGAAAGATGAGDAKEALLIAKLSASSASAASCGLFAVSGSGSSTRIARLCLANGNFDALAEDRVFQLDRDVGT